MCLHRNRVRLEVGYLSCHFLIYPTTCQWWPQCYWPRRSRSNKTNNLFLVLLLLGQRKVQCFSSLWERLWWAGSLLLLQHQHMLRMWHLTSSFKLLEKVMPSYHLLKQERHIVMEWRAQRERGGDSTYSKYRTISGENPVTQMKRQKKEHVQEIEKINRIEDSRRYLYVSMVLWSCKR